MALYKFVKKVKKSTKIPLIIKLSPNVTDIKIIARATEEGGATVSAMLIDTEPGEATLSHKIGGLSRPTIKPIALRCVYQITKAVKIPVISIGGITSGKDAIEMIMAGATAVGKGGKVAEEKRHLGIDNYYKNKENIIPEDILVFL